MPSTDSTESNITAPSNSKSPPQSRPKNHKLDRLQELIQGIALYAFCIFVPAIFGVIVRLYNDHIPHRSDSKDGSSSSSSFPYSLANNVLFVRYYDSATKCLCEVTGFCYNNVATLSRSQKKMAALKSIFSLSIIMLLVRIMLVYVLILKGGTVKKSTMIKRCKSIHLLSEAGEEQDKEEDEGQPHNVSILKTMLSSRIPSIKKESETKISAPSSSTYTPRHATAIFRLIYTFFSSMLALLLFRHASFWPRYLFGQHPHSSTRNCWDLSGSIVGHLDSDFDNQKQNLQRFFILSASYHLQSLIFNVGSILIIIATSSNKLKSALECIRSYARPLLEHLLVMALMSISFVFSSLRRLCAVGYFTLDFSSFFLHLLVVCLHIENDDTEEGKKSFRRRAAIFVHRYLAIPIFLYCRFYIFPFVIWYSAIYESRAWLDQMEHAFAPGWANMFYIVFNGLCFIILVLNMLLFQKLINYPRLMTHGEKKETKRL